MENIADKILLIYFSFFAENTDSLYMQFQCAGKKLENMIKICLYPNLVVKSWAFPKYNVACYDKNIVLDSRCMQQG